MRGYLPDSYGDSFEDYESAHSRLLPDPAPMVDVLARLAGGGPALELGIGSGRVARPLAEQAIEVDGIEISERMIEQLRRSAEGLPIRVFHGDFSETGPPRKYRLVYCIWSTFFYLTTSQAQARAFGHVARALDGGGVYVLEAYTPNPERFRDGQEVKIIELAADSATLQLAVHHPETQTIESRRLIIGRDGIRGHPVLIRYSSTEELDEMATAAGLRLRDRWADWKYTPFTDESAFHVSVYEPAA